MGMFTEEVKCEFNGVEIAVSLFFDANMSAMLKMHINGKAVAENSVYSPLGLPKKVALLRSAFQSQDGEHIIEVYATGFFNQRLIIRIDEVERARSKG